VLIYFIIFYLRNMMLQSKTKIPEDRSSPRIQIHIHTIWGYILSTVSLVVCHKLFFSILYSTIEQALECKELWSMSNGVSICYRCHNCANQDDNSINSTIYGSENNNLNTKWAGSGLNQRPPAMSGLIIN
jgi:hypothetical protein